ncbi:MAG: ADP-forming succinate--CoA ligase subunit beta [Candidatus Omnitrophica bacterium]|nr:ADP-forming succinate--CoA ligase subunit beta [Candidatus Omnitrophota bacterium]
MNIHEYQAKEIFRKFGIPVSEGRLVTTPGEAREAFSALGSVPVVVKAQVHAGGRGKAGGIKFEKSAGEAEKAAAGMIGLKMKTHQTGGLEKTVHKVWIEQLTDIAKEFYLGVTIDREVGLPVIIFSSAGGMSIEEVAAQSPEQIYRMHFEPDKLPDGKTLQAFVSKALSNADRQGKFAKIVENTAKLFVSVDASLVEINPLCLMPDGGIRAVDAKINFDDNALFRHSDVEALRDPLEEDPREREAKKFDLSYVGLNGNIGCMVNGAGLAMATMDIIKLYGAEPANFLDVGGNATTEKIAAAFNILTSDKNVKAILINIFGGIVRCNLIAEGILAALKNVKLSVPLVVRLEGTNAKEGKELLEKSGVNVIAASSLSDAAEKAVKAVGRG